MTNNKKAGSCCFYPTAIALLISAFTPTASFATEGQASSYPMGAENFFTGIAPPPGFYSLFYGQHYEADNLRGNDGDKLPVDFKVRSDALVPRLIWVSDMTLLGGSPMLHTMLPLVNVKGIINGDSQRKHGIGDISFGTGLGYHFTPQFHAIFALDVTAPTGSYHKDDLVNVGRNYWMFEPLIALTWTQPRGLNIDAKIMYDFNVKNPDTEYRSGQEFHIDYAAGWEVADGWVVGVGGYVYRQITDDKQNGDRIENNKGRAFAIGPSFKYTGSGGWFMTAKWQQESDVRNRAQGDAWWLRLVVPL